MPAPKARSAGPFSCKRTVQPRCLSATAAVRPANPAPAISACRVFPLCRLMFVMLIRIPSYRSPDALPFARGFLLVLPHERIEIGRIVDDAFLFRGIDPED